MNTTAPRPNNYSRRRHTDYGRRVCRASVHVHTHRVWLPERRDVVWGAVGYGASASPETHTHTTLQERMGFARSVTGKKETLPWLTAGRCTAHHGRQQKTTHRNAQKTLTRARAPNTHTLSLADTHARSHARTRCLAATRGVGMVGAKGGR